MASSAGGMTKLLLNGSHIPSPRVYVNLQRTRRADKASKVTGLGFSITAEEQGKSVECSREHVYMFSRKLSRTG